VNPFIERARLDKIKSIKQQLEDAKHQLEVSQRQGQYEKASQLRFATIPELERQLPVEDERASDDVESPLVMLHDRVTSNDIARVVAKSTGIPVQNLLKGERDKLVHVRTISCSSFSSQLYELDPSRWKMYYVAVSSARTMLSRPSVMPFACRVLVCKHRIALLHLSSSSGLPASARHGALLIWITLLAY
jgi:hypothetical protein